jgi:hypothetical protein
MSTQTRRSRARTSLAERMHSSRKAFQLCERSANGSFEVSKLHYTTRGRGARYAFGELYLEMLDIEVIGERGIGN